MVEGDFGIGLVHRLVRGYTFISRNYAADDAIYLVGFSRGAYGWEQLHDYIRTTDRARLDRQALRP